MTIAAASARLLAKLDAEAAGLPHDPAPAVAAARTAERADAAGIRRDFALDVVRLIAPLARPDLVKMYPSGKTGKLPKWEVTDLIGHVEGRQPLGVYPVWRDGSLSADGAAMAGMTRLAVLDLDDHDPKPKSGDPPPDSKRSPAERWAVVWRFAGPLLDVLRAAGAKPFVVRSRGGRGVHLWLLFDQPVSAAAVRRWLRGVVARAGLTAGDGGVARQQVEIFPKQDSVPSDGWGSHVALPLVGNGMGAVLAGNGEPLQLEGMSADELTGLLPQPTLVDVVAAGMPGAEVAVDRPAWLDKYAAELPDNTEYFVYQLDMTKVRSAVMHIARLGEAAGRGSTTVGVVRRDGWRSILFALTDVAQQHPNHEEELWQLFDEASKLGAAYDAAENRDQWDRTIKSGYTGPRITVGSLYAAAAASGWVWDGVSCDEPGPKARDLAGVPTPGVRPANGAPLAAWVAYFNMDHAMVMVGGKARVLREDEEGPMLAAAHEIRDMYANLTATRGRGGKLINAFDGWRKHPDRRTYLKGMDLLADKSTEQAAALGFYNLWRGFGVEPRAGAWPTIQWFLHHVICAGNVEHTTYLLNLLAWKVQHPGERAQVSPVLRSGEGTGKGTLGAVLHALFGRHYLAVSHSRHLTGHFNGHLHDKVIVFADEAFWAGDKAGEGALKSLITEPHLVIERKMLDAVAVENRLLLVIASNEAWVVPAGADARRFFVLDVSEEKKRDHVYFDNLRASFDVEIPAMLHDLQQRDLSGFNRHAVPMTAALFQQKALTKLSAGSVDEWWRKCLQEEQIVGSASDWTPVPGRAVRAAWPTEVKKEGLRDAFNTFRHRDGSSHRPISDAAFGMRLKQLCTLGESKAARELLTTKRGVILPDGTRPRMYQLGLLKEHRQAMADLYGVSPEQLLGD